MRIDGRRYRDEWLPNYYPSRPVGDHYVRISRAGRPQLLTAEEDSQLTEFFMDEALFDRLERTGHIITSSNASLALKRLKTWMKGTYDGPQLHIVVATKRCNLNCTYCHMNPEPAGEARSRFDLSPEISRHIVRFILESPNPHIEIEFQGGEPFLNFDGVIAFVNEISSRNKQIGKTIRFNIVSNLMVASDGQLQQCLDNNIFVSYTLNGPREMHDHFRQSRTGRGSYDVVMNRLTHIRSRFPNVLATSPLCVVTSENVRHLTEMVDFYYDLGFSEVGIICLRHLGNAVRNELQFDAKEFITSYVHALDYMYEKNKSAARPYSERMIRLALLKIFCDVDVPYVDWRNPIGYVNGGLVYDYDGEILPADEARSMRGVFTLGNVTKLSYDALIRRKETFNVVNLSLRDRDPACRECAYNPYCGVSPVLHYARTGDLNPRAYQNNDCLIVLAILDWTFKKLLEDPLPLARMVPQLTEHLAGAASAATDLSGRQRELPEGLITVQLGRPPIAHGASGAGAGETV
jgi:radical SAM protein with 4Fe4S-binding SPASM domain